MLAFSQLPYQIKSLPEGTKVLRSLIDNSIKEGDWSDAWKFVAYYCENGSSQIKGIDFYQSYSPLACADSFIINIAIAAMHRLTYRVLMVAMHYRIKMFPFMKESVFFTTLLSQLVWNILSQYSSKSILWSILSWIYEWNSREKTSWTTMG